MNRVPRPLLAVLVASAVLVVAGAVLMSISEFGAASFGWYSYAPLSDSVFDSQGLVLLPQLTVLGGAGAALGLIGLAAAAGWALGSRHQSRLG